MRFYPTKASFALLFGALHLPVLSHAGGSGLNTFVVINQASTNSIELGNYFVERRQVPPQNVLRINWPGENTYWSRTDYELNLLAPVTNAIAARGLTNQIDYIALSMDIPFGVTESNAVNSTTSALFYGFKDDPTRTGSNPCTLPPATTNQYAGAEVPFRMMPGSTPGTFLCTMLTADTLALAKAMVDSGVNSDATFPTNTVWLEKTSDIFRNVRFTASDNTAFNFRVSGSSALVQTNSDQTSGLSGLMGLQTGLANFTVASDTFAPGAMADSLTSFAGVIFGPNSQTTLLALTRAGAAGGYGTVVEPCNYPDKFPSPQNYFFQSRGFNLAECYLMSVTNPYMGLVVGEPLAAPFARSGTGTWMNLPENAVLSGTTNLALLFTAADATRPLQQVDLFVDGHFFATLTNIVPAPGNRVQAVVNGRTLNYTVQSGDTVGAVASGLAAVFNNPGNQAVLNVDAVAHGDRIELQAASFGSSGTTNSVSSLTNTATTLTTFLRATRTNFLDSIARGRREITIGGTMVIGDYLQLVVTKTNGANVTVEITNNSANATLTSFVEEFVNAINAASDLQGSDGLAAEDFIPDQGNEMTSFNLRPRSIGWPAARMQAHVLGTFDITPLPTQRLDENLHDLQPRNHLYVTAGVTNLAVGFGLNTAQLGDGWHELVAVAYEGSHVRTQTRANRIVLVQNGTLTATLSSQITASNVAVEATLPFVVQADTSNVDRIELFSTGGSLAAVSNQATANFSITGTNLGAGLHPFYAVVTAATNTFRTQTKYLRLVGLESSLTLAPGAVPGQFSWPTVAARRYDVLSTTNLIEPFAIRETITATNAGPFLWGETNQTTQQYYRVRTAP